MFKFAFRNVMRNKKRTFFTALAIFFGAFAVGLSLGWMNGIIQQMMQGFVNYQTGNVRITTEEYIKRERFMPVDTLIDNPQPLIDKLKTINRVVDVEEKIPFAILLGYKDTTVNAMGVGLNLLDNHYNLSNKLISGEISESGIYIGSGLAKKLGVKQGEELLLATTTSMGGLNGIKLPIKGIFQMTISMYDDHYFFISLEDAKRLLKITDATIGIYIYTKQIGHTIRVYEEINRMLPPGLTALSFKEQIGGLGQMYEMMNVIIYFIEFLILFLASFVVINTMMMAIFERMPEIGMLKAMGMSDLQVFFNFTLEGGIIGAMGGVIGAVVGVVLINLIGVTGLDLQGMMTNIDFPIEYIVRPHAGITELIAAIVMSIIVPMLAAMLPARRARKLTPVEAMRNK